MFYLPNEIVGHIFSFDSTFHDYFKRKILRQLKNQVFFCKHKSIYCKLDLSN